MNVNLSQILIERTTRERMRREREHRKILRWVGIGLFLLFLLTIYTIVSANCATGGDCTFANGDVANLLLPKLQATEKWFWEHISGNWPGRG